jgi:hypothetical protein
MHYAKSVDSVITVPMVGGQTSFGLVLINAEVNGHRGIFVLDTGSPVIAPNPLHLDPAGHEDGRDTSITGAMQPPSSRAVQSNGGFTFRLGGRTLYIDSMAAHAAGDGNGATIVALPEPIARALEAGLHRPLMGILGLPALASFETVFDYANQKVSFIPIDPTGHRPCAVPAYTPAVSIPMTPQSKDGVHWFVHGILGDSTATALLLDTGAWRNTLLARAFQQVQPQLRAISDSADYGEPIYRLERLTIGDYQISHTDFGLKPEGFANALGSPFFRQQRIVGFNFRTRKFVVRYTAEIHPVTQQRDAAIRTDSTVMSILGERLGLSQLVYDPTVDDTMGTSSPTRCVIAALREEFRATRTAAAQQTFCEHDSS